MLLLRFISSLTHVSTQDIYYSITNGNLSIKPEIILAPLASCHSETCQGITHMMAGNAKMTVELERFTNSSAYRPFVTWTI